LARKEGRVGRACYGPAKSSIETATLGDIPAYGVAVDRASQLADKVVQCVTRLISPSANVALFLEGLQCKAILISEIVVWLNPVSELLSPDVIPKAGLAVYAPLVLIHNIEAGAVRPDPRVRLYGASSQIFFPTNPNTLPVDLFAIFPYFVQKFILRL